MPDEPGALLLRIVVLVALLVGAVVATAEADAWWTVALASVPIARPVSSSSTTRSSVTPGA